MSSNHDSILYSNFFVEAGDCIVAKVLTWICKGDLAKEDNVVLYEKGTKRSMKIVLIFKQHYKKAIIDNPIFGNSREIGNFHHGRSQRWVA